MSTTLTTKSALVTALVMAVEAPTDEQAARASALAERLASTLTLAEVNQAKRQARVVCEVNEAQGRTLDRPVIVK